MLKLWELNLTTGFLNFNDISVAQNVECQYDWQLSEPVIKQQCYFQLCHLLSGRTSPQTIL